MKLTVLGSSSSGNCYVLTSSKGSSLIIEAGLKFSEVKKSLNFSLSNIVGVLVSHEHGDHSKYIDTYVEFGVPCLTMKSVFESRGIKKNRHRYCKYIHPHKGYMLGRGFRVFTFPLHHDVPCLGFIISHEEMGKLMFATDTMMMTHCFPEINHFLIEANYSDKKLSENIESGVTHPSMKKRLMMTHMELSTTIDVIKSHPTSDIQNIILIHLSSNNSDEDEFVQRFREELGREVLIATKGLTVELDTKPY